MLRCRHCSNEEQEKFLGHQDSDVYDGVISWQCLVCGFAWARDFGPGMDRRNEAARRDAEQINSHFYDKFADVD